MKINKLKSRHNTMGLLKKIAACLLTLVFVITVMSGCKENENTENVSGELSYAPDEAIGIAIKQYPTKLTYKVGEKLDDTGMKVNILFGDQSEKTYVSGWECSHYDFKQEGSYLVTVKFKGLSTSFTVTVVADPDNQPVSIEVASMPTKTEYSVGEKADYTGLKVKAIYEDGSSKIISGVSCYVHPFDKAGTYEVTVEYGELETTFQVHVH